MQLNRLRRREFIMLLGGTANWPLAARAQQPATLSIIGFAGGDTPEQWAILLRAFRLGLKATGFIEGQNVAIEYRWAEGRNDKLSEFAVDLVRRCMSSEHFGQLAWQFKRMSGSSGLKVQAAIAC